MRIARILACAVGLCSAAATAQSIDPTRARATIGEPLDLEVLVRTTPELGAARLARSCVRAQVLDGQRQIDDDALAIDISPAAADGQNRLRIRHASLVDEPVVQARLSLTCGANYTRDFTVLSQVRAGLASTASSSPTTKVRSRPTRGAGKSQQASRSATAGQTAPATSGPIDATPHQAAAATSGAAVTEPSGGPGDIGALARSVLRLFQAAGLDLQRSSQGLLDPHQPDSTASRAAADSQYLMQEVQRLRSESQQSATAIASLHARVERAESDRWLHTSWTVLAVIAGLIILAIAVRLADLVAPLLLRRLARRAAETDRSVDLQAKQGPSIEQYLKDMEARPTPPSVDQASASPAPQVEHGSMSLTFDEVESSSPAKAATTMRQQANVGTPAPAQARAHRWANAEFGPPSLDHRRVRLHRNDIDQAIVDGHLGFALVMLEQLLHSGDGKHPWVLMRLLDVYRELRQQDNHERVCAEIEALYAVRVPGFATAPLDLNDADAFEQLTEWPDLHSAWSSDEASLLIASCLLRGDQLVEHNLATFADLLFLHELAEIRDAPPQIDQLAA